MSRRARGTKRRSLTIPIVIMMVVVGILVAYLIYSQTAGNPTDPLIGTPVPQSVMNEISGVSFGTLNTIGVGGSTTGPTAISASSALTLNGKPEVLYMGAEYCPYCAAERWALTVALTKFGNFTGLEYMRSADSPEPYPNTATFTYVNAAYTSNYISLVTVEQESRAEQPLQTPTAAQQALISQYDSGGSIPFIDFGNQYAQVGTQVDAGSLTGQNWTQIASQLNTPTSTVAKNIDGAANRLIHTICLITGNQPSSVCSQPVYQTLGLQGSGAGLSDLFVSSIPTYLRPPDSYPGRPPS